MVSRLNLGDYTFLHRIGIGIPNRVYLVKSKVKARSEVIALRIAPKHTLINMGAMKDYEQATLAMRKAIKDPHPFIVEVFGVCQTMTDIVVFMEFCQGGDMNTNIQRRAFDLALARFYLSEVLLGLEWFHKNGILHRNLLLDNILLQAGGHIKLTGFQYCKTSFQHGDVTREFCGRWEFMPYEMLLDKDYGFEVDWWAFGIVACQMIFRQSPFRGDDEEEIFTDILISEPRIPENVDPNAEDLIQKLLDKNQRSRLGFGETGVEDVKAHKFFENVNWQDVYNKRIEPPFIPVFEDDVDVQNFDDIDWEEELVPFETSATELTDEELQMFDDLDFVHHF